MAHPALAVNDKLHVTLFATLHGQTIMNTLYFVVGGVLTSNPTLGFASLNAQIREVLEMNMLDDLSSEFKWTGIRIQRFAPVKSIFVDFFDDPPLVGGDTATSEPPQVATILNRRTEIAGRPGRGRLFLAGYSHAYYSQGKTNVTSRGAIGAQWKKLLVDDLVDGSWEFYGRHLVREPGQFGYHIITDVDVSEVIGTNRRRRVGRGI